MVISVLQTYCLVAPFNPFACLPSLEQPSKPQTAGQGMFLITSVGW